jgi:hypothetical protein
MTIWATEVACNLFVCHAAPKIGIVASSTTIRALIPDYDMISTFSSDGGSNFRVCLAWIALPKPIDTK